MLQNKCFAQNPRGIGRVWALFVIFATLSFLCGCSNDDPSEDGKSQTAKHPYSGSVPNVIIDTDLGNSADDALAMQMLFKYRSEGKLNLLAVMNGIKVKKAKQLLDCFMHYYKADDVPVGLIEGEESIFEMMPYYQLVDSVYADGTPWLPSTGTPLTDRLPAWKEYRKRLSLAADNSVSIVCIGPFTSLGKLMDSEADEYSPLSGMELIKQKVRQLDVMAGSFTKVKLRFHKGYIETEYNVAGDIPLAKKLLEGWPTDLHIFPLEEGMKYPSDHDEVLNDYAWNPQNPMYLIYSHYNEWEKGDVGQYWWDPITVLHTVEPDKYFDCTEQGVLSVSEKGVTTFEAKEGGKVHVISVNPQHTWSVYQYLSLFSLWKP